MALPLIVDPTERLIRVAKMIVRAATRRGIVRSGVALMIGAIGPLRNVPSNAQVLHRDPRIGEPTSHLTSGIARFGRAKIKVPAERRDLHTNAQTMPRPGGRLPAGVQRGVLLQEASRQDQGLPGRDHRAPDPPPEDRSKEATGHFLLETIVEAGLPVHGEMIAAIDRAVAVREAVVAAKGRMVLNVEAPVRRSAVVGRRANGHDPGGRPSPITLDKKVRTSASSSIFFDLGLPAPCPALVAIRMRIGA